MNAHHNSKEIPLQNPVNHNSQIIVQVIFGNLDKLVISMLSAVNKFWICHFSYKNLFHFCFNVKGPDVLLVIMRIIIYFLLLLPASLVCLVVAIKQAQTTAVITDSLESESLDIFEQYRSIRSDTLS